MIRNSAMFAISFSQAIVLRNFLPRNARSAKPDIAIIKSSICLSVTLTYHGHIGWTSSKLITRIISLVSSFLGAVTLAI